jgi:hypothetical protein
VRYWSGYPVQKARVIILQTCKQNQLIKPDKGWVSAWCCENWGVQPEQNPKHVTGIKDAS